MLPALVAFYQTEPAIAWIVTACASVTVVSGVYFVISSRSARSWGG